MALHGNFFWGDVSPPLHGWIDGQMAVKSYLVRCMHAHSSIEIYSSLNIRKLYWGSNHITTNVNSVLNGEKECEGR